MVFAFVVLFLVSELEHFKLIASGASWRPNIGEGVGCCIVLLLLTHADVPLVFGRDHGFTHGYVGDLLTRSMVLLMDM